MKLKAHTQRCKEEMRFLIWLDVALETKTTSQVMRREI
jgi:hypothetical protein